MGERPVVLCPAMNTLMFHHPLTAAHLAAVGTVYSAVLVGPISKRLACDDVGIGAMSTPEDIAAAVRTQLVKSGFALGQAVGQQEGKAEPVPATATATSSDSSPTGD